MIGVAKLFVDQQRRALADIRRRLEAILNQLGEKDLHWRPAGQSDSAADVVVRICDAIAGCYSAMIFPADAPFARPARPQSAKRITGGELQTIVAGEFSRADALLRGMPLASLVDPKRSAHRPTWVLDLLAETTLRCGEELGRVNLMASQRLGKRYIPPIPGGGE